MIQQEERVGLGEMLRFFWPIALTSTLTMFTHTIISGGLSRTLNPASATAAYTIALGLAEIFEAPVVILRQVVLVYLQSKQAFKTIWTVYLTTVCAMMALVLTIAFYAPVTRYVLQTVLGVSDTLLPATLAAFRITMLLPIVSGFRCIYQGIALVGRRTSHIAAAMAVRVGFMWVLVAVLSQRGLPQGSLLGAIAIVGGVVVEGLTVFLLSRGLSPTADRVLGYRPVWLFYYPLIVSTLLVSVGKPILNASLARTPNAVVALASFSIATSVAWLFIAPAQSIHLLVMVFGRSVEDRPQVARFSLVLTLLSTTLLLGFSLSSLGPYVLSKFVGVPAEILDLTILSMRVLAFLPLVICWQEYNSGLLLLAESTRLVGLSKLVNIAAIILACRLPSVVTAPLAQLVGFACGGAVLQLGRLYIQRTEPRQVITQR